MCRRLILDCIDIDHLSKMSLKADWTPPRRPSAELRCPEFRTTLEAFAGVKLIINEIGVWANIKRTLAREVERSTCRVCVRHACAKQRENRDRCFSERGSHNCPVWPITFGIRRTAVPRHKRIYTVNRQNTTERSEPAGPFATWSMMIEATTCHLHKERSSLVWSEPDRLHQSGANRNN
jgi:hypothetical protein